jgi:hypothetical protein
MTPYNPQHLSLIVNVLVFVVNEEHLTNLFQLTYSHFQQQGKYTEDKNNQTEKVHVCNPEEQLSSSSDQQTDVAVNNFHMDQEEYDLTNPQATQIHHTTTTAVRRKQAMFTEILHGKLLPFWVEADTSSTTDSQSLHKKWQPSIPFFDVCHSTHDWEPYAVCATVLENRSPENLLLQDRKWLLHTNAVQDMDQQFVCLQDTLERQTMQVMSYDSLLGSFTFELFPRNISYFLARQRHNSVEPSVTQFLELFGPQAYQQHLENCPIILKRTFFLSFGEVKEFSVQASFVRVTCTKQHMRTYELKNHPGNHLFANKFRDFQTNNTKLAPFGNCAMESPSLNEFIEMFRQLNNVEESASVNFGIESMKNPIEPAHFVLKHTPLSKSTCQDSCESIWLAESAQFSVVDDIFSFGNNLSYNEVNVKLEPGYVGPFRIVPNGGKDAAASENLWYIQILQDTSLQNCWAPEKNFRILSESQILNREFMEYIKQHRMSRTKVKNEMEIRQRRKIYPDFKSTLSTRKEVFRKAHDLDYCYKRESMLGDKHIKTTGDL